MPDFHELTEASQQYGDGIRVYVCHQCGWSVALLCDGRLKIVNQGDFYALHRYGIALNVEVQDA